MNINLVHPGHPVASFVFFLVDVLAPSNSLTQSDEEKQQSTKLGEPGEAVDSADWK